MRGGLDDAAEFLIVGLALGGKYVRDVLLVMKRTWPDTPDAEIVAGCREIASGSKLQKMAERIVLTSMASLADGEPIDDHMRPLIAAWCRRRLKGGVAGRRSDSMKTFAVQWAFIERVWKNPSDKRVCAPIFFTRPNVMFAGWNTRSSPYLTPQPGANIGVRCGNGVVAFDFDDEEAALAISEVFDPSPVNKAGQRAWTPFNRADFPVPSEDFFDGQGRKVLQILSDGRQTVIPPSIHPDTNEPYRWTNGRSLYDTLPRDYRERILALGYVSGKKKPADTINLETGEIENGFDDNPCAELNSVALKNLPSWVPDLGLYNCKRRSGRYPAYDAVASWRPSTTGRPLEQRKRNLGIVGSGIKDFGTGKSYSPIDLVMAVRGGGVGEARCWLEEKLLPKKPEADIDIEKCVEAHDVPLIAPKNGDEQRADDGAPKQETASGERKYRFRLMSFSELKPGGPKAGSWTAIVRAFTALKHRFDYTYAELSMSRGVPVLTGMKRRY